MCIYACVHEMALYVVVSQGLRLCVLTNCSSHHFWGINSLIDHQTHGFC